MKPVPAQLTFTDELVPGPRHLASAVGNRGVHVVSSPATILFIEMACHQAIDDYLDDHEATVGTHFELAHKGAAVPGVALEVQVELIHRSDKNQLRFRARVEQRGKLIMVGEHGRAVVDLQRLLGRTTASAELQWKVWFDLRSAWSSLFIARLLELADHYDARLQWCPVLWPDTGIATPVATPAASDSLAQARYRWQQHELLEYAALAGIVLQPERQLPVDDTAVMLACVAAADHRNAAPFYAALAAARWSDGEDLSDPALLAALGQTHGLDPAELIPAVTTRRHTDTLADNHRQAIAAGVFEMATVQMQGKLYCGYHGLNLLEQHTLDSLGH